MVTETTNADGSPVTITDNDIEPIWHNPLEECVVRWQTNARGGSNLAYKEGATFGVSRDGFMGIHQGLDLLAEPGRSQCKAVATGKLSVVGSVNDKKNYGLVLILEVQKKNLATRQRKHFDLLCPEHDKLFFAYCHCSSVVKNLVDTEVEAGTLIGISGSTGNAGFLHTKAMGAHVHFEVRLDINPGRGLAGRLDPAPFLDDLKWDDPNLPNASTPFKTWNPFYPHDVPAFYKDRVFHFPTLGSRFDRRGENELWATGEGGIKMRSYSFLTANERELFSQATERDINFPHP